MATVTALLGTEIPIRDQGVDWVLVGRYQLIVGSPHGAIVVASEDRWTFPYGDGWRTIRRVQLLSRLFRLPGRKSGARPVPHTESPLHKASDDRLLARFKALTADKQRVLLAMASLGGASLTVSHLNALTMLEDTAPALESLLHLEWVTRTGHHYHLSPSVSRALSQAYDLTPLREHALAYFTRLAVRKETTPMSLVDDVDAIQHLSSWTARIGRWAATWRLVRATQAIVALSKDWEAWYQMLQQGLAAAQALRLQSGQAWTWHQLGTRALCLGQHEDARSALARALSLRQANGEPAAAAVTRHNLNQLVEVESSAAAMVAQARGRRRFLLPLALFGVLGVVLLLWFAFGRESEPPASSDSGTVAPTSVAAVAVGPTTTATPARTRVLPASATTTATATTTTTLTPTPSPTPCFVQAPAGWVQTTIAQGDTLTRLARRHNASISRIMRVNCLPDDKILAGFLLWLPPLPPTPTPTLAPAHVQVQTVRQTGQPVAAGDVILVPVAVSLANTGGRDADFSRLSFAYSAAGDGRTPLAFNPAAPPPTIAAGEDVSDVAGTVAFPVDLYDQTVALWASADTERSLSLHLGLPPPVVWIETVSGRPGRVSALLFDEESERWYTDLELVGHVDKPASLEIQSWTWTEGGQRIGSGPSLTHRLYSDTTCLSYDIELTVTATYFGGRFPVSQSADVGFACNP